MVTFVMTHYAEVYNFLKGELIRQRSPSAELTVPSHADLIESLMAQGF